MRLSQYINEGHEEFPFGEDINESIHKNCKQYLKLIKGLNPLYRGMDAPYDIGIKDVRKDRTPFGMNVDEALVLNHMLQKNGHARRDKSVMCTSDDDHLELFGHPYLIFPLDRIKKYTWFDGPDVNMEGHSGWTDSTIPAWVASVVGPNDWTDWSGNNVDHVLDKLEKPVEKFFTTNKGFNRAHKHGYEMWIECDKYYYVDTHLSKWDKNKQMFVRK